MSVNIRSKECFRVAMTGRWRKKKKKKKKKKNIVLRLQSLSRRYSASFCLTRIA